MSKARQQANLSSDGNLFADISNDRVGVGSVVPTHKLHVNGTSKFDDDVKFEGTTAAKNITWDKSYDGLKVSDDAKVSFGAANDLDIYHTTSGTSWIRHGNTSEYFVIEGNQIDFREYTNAKYRARMGTAVTLYHDNSPKFETTNTGAKVTGNLEVTGVLTYEDVTSVDSVGIVTARQGIHIDDSIVHIGDTDTKIRFPAADTITAETAGSERLRINSTGKVGIGTNNPSNPLHVLGADPQIKIQDSANGNHAQIFLDGSNSNLNFDWVSGSDRKINFINSGSGGISVGINSQDPSATLEIHDEGSTGPCVLIRGATSTEGDVTVPDGETFNFGHWNYSSSTFTERLRISSVGEVLINQNNARSYVDGAGYTQTPKLQVEADDNTSSAIALRYNSGAGAATRRASFIFARTADGTAVSNNSVLGEVLFMGEGNSTLEKAASIRAEVDGAPGTDDMPGRLIFSTTADGSDSLTERLRIDSSDRIGIGGNGIGNGLGVFLRRSSPTTTNFYEASDGTKTMITGVDSTNDYVKIGSLSNHRVGIVANNGEKLSITSDGKIGIGGATSPEELLDLGNALQINLKVGGRAYLGQGYSTAATILGHSVKAKTTGTVTGGMEVTETNSGGGAPTAIRMQSGRIEFHTASSGTSGATFDSERLRIKSNGQVYVGNAFSTAAIFGLNVVDDTVLSDSMGLYNSTATNFIEIANTGDGITGKESGILLRTRTSGCGVWAIYNKRIGTYTSDLVFRTRSGASTSAERLRLTNAGNLNLSGGDLSITSSLAKIIMTDSDGGDSYQIRNDGGSFHIRNSTDSRSDITIAGNGGVNISSKIEISAAGNMGFNTSPSGTYYVDILNGTSAQGIRLRSTGSQYHDLVFDANRTSAANALGRIVGKWNGNDVAMIQVQTGEDTTNKDDGRIRFYTSESGGSVLERMQIAPNGTVNIGGANEVQLDANNEEILYLHGAVVGANVDFAFGMRIDLDDDDTGTTSADRERGSAMFQFNGNATGGDTSNETRIWNIFSDVNCTEDYDNVYGFYADVRTGHQVGTVSEIRGVYGLVQTTDSGNVTNMTGLYGLAQTTTGANSETVNDMVGVRGRVNMTAGDSTANATDIMGVWGNIDNDNNTTQPAGGKCALFYGSYDKTTGLHQPSGIRIDTNVPNYFRGDLAIGAGANFIPDKALHIKDTDNGGGIHLHQTGNNYTVVKGNANRTGADNSILQITGFWDDTQVCAIRLETGSDTTNKDDGELQFFTASAGTVTDRMHIQPNGEIAMKSDDTPTDALANLHVQNGTFRVSQSSNPTTAYTQITAHTSGQDGNRHRIATWNTADICSFAVDHNGTVMAYASHYAGRTRGDANNAQPEMYRHGAHHFTAYSARTDDATNVRTLMMMRAWDAGDRGDRNILYYADSNSDTTSCDYDQHQTFGVKADGSVHGLVRFFSGRVESDEATPNSVYGSGRGGIYGYESDSVGQVYFLAEAGGSSSSYFVFARTGNNDIQWKHRTSDGRMYVDATATTFNGADYAEYFEWSDGNSSNEDRAGYTVVLKDGGKIGIATAGDSPSSIIGVISAAPAIVGDGQDLSWRGKWKKDEFGREITTPVQYLVWNHGYEDDENGNRVPVKQPDPTDQVSMQNADTHGEVGPKLDKMIADGKVPQFAIDNNIIMNATRRVKDPLYDETKKYVPREFRQEWSPVGLVGKLIVRKGQVVGDRWIKMKDINDQLEQWMIR